MHKRVNIAYCTQATTTIAKVRPKIQLAIIIVHSPLMLTRWLLFIAGNVFETFDSLPFLIPPPFHLNPLFNRPII
jgi:hypothetical protein